VLSASTVSRGLIVLEQDKLGQMHTVKLTTEIALARCLRCGTRARVLPYDVLPYKLYSLTVITKLVITYTTGNWSLRDAVWDLLGEPTPAHTTLHGWTEGLGAHVLGLPGAQTHGAPFSRFVFEAQARMAPIAQVVHAPFSVDERRYRSQARRERLAGLAMLMALAGLVAGELNTNALVWCRHLILLWSNTCVLVFPSQFPCTPIELASSANRAESEPPPVGSSDPCPTRTRSPPGASSRSPR